MVFHLTHKVSEINVARIMHQFVLLTRYIGHLRNGPLVTCKHDQTLKLFDRVSWDSLWENLLRHVVSQHLVPVTKQDASREFDIKAGLRQGCVLSPRLFAYVLEVALKKWRKQLQDGGLEIGDDGIPLFGFTIRF